jgi:hypothetical protein
MPGASKYVLKISKNAPSTSINTQNISKKFKDTDVWPHYNVYDKFLQRRDLS